MPLTNAQKQAKHRLAVKERLQRYEAALGAIADLKAWGEGDVEDMAAVAREALNPTDPAKS